MSIKWVAMEERGFAKLKQYTKKKKQIGWDK